MGLVNHRERGHHYAMIHHRNEVAENGGRESIHLDMG